MRGRGSAFLCAVALALLAAERSGSVADTKVAADVDRSPIALALSSDGSRILTANQTANSVSLVDPVAGKVLDEIATGDRPAGIAIAPDGKSAVVTHWYGYDVAFLDIRNDKLSISGRLEVGPEPRGVAIDASGKTAFVAVGVANEVVKIDLAGKTISGRVSVGREPRSVAISPDGAALVVGDARSQELSFVDLKTFTVKRNAFIDGDNLRRTAFSPDGKYAYVVNMKNRRFATNKNHIDLGWVLGQRLTRVALGEEGFETLSLDPQGKAVGDVCGLAISGDGKLIAIAAGGTHEVLLIALDKGEIPWRQNASRDLLKPELLNGDGRFRRVQTGGRPVDPAFSADNKTLYCANYLLNAVQAIDCDKAQLESSIDLGGPAAPSLARRGEALFHDAARSFHQWYSCNTCHADGHTSGMDFDTKNDGYQDLSTSHTRSRKKTPSLRRVARTGPWTWHGWQKSLDEAMVESFTKSMEGPRPSEDEIRAIVAFLETLDYPKNPHRGASGTPAEAVARGEKLFKSARAGCSGCHSGPELTDGKVHEAGLEERYDFYKGYNPPSLIGVYDKDPYLHDGRAKTLEEALKGPHGPDTVLGGDPLTDAEIADLVAYLKTL